MGGWNWDVSIKGEIVAMCLGGVIRFERTSADCWRPPGRRGSCAEVEVEAIYLCGPDIWKTHHSVGPQPLPDLRSALIPATPEGECERLENQRARVSSPRINFHSGQAYTTKNVLV